MSLYPPAATAQELYEGAQTSARARPGMRATFETDEGFVEAVYVTNALAASIASGTPVHLTSRNYGVATAGLAAAQGAIPVLGILCGTLAASTDASSGNGGAWAAYAGPITAIKVVATDTSTVNALLATAHSAGGSIETVASTAASNTAQVWGRLLGNFGGATGNIATSGGAGVYLNLNLWR